MRDAGLAEGGYEAVTMVDFEAQPATGGSGHLGLVIVAIVAAAGAAVLWQGRRRSV